MPISRFLGAFFSNTSGLHGLGVGRSEEAISNFTDSCYKYLKMSSFSLGNQN